MLRQACKIFVVHAQRNNLTKRFFWKAYHFFSVSRFRAKAFWKLTRYFWQGCHNCILRVQMKIFFTFWRKEKREIFLFEKVALLSFSDFERRRSSVLLQVWLRQAYQNIVVHVETNIFTDRFFWKVYHFFGISGIPAKSFHSFDENVLTGLSQLQSRCTEEQFEEKDFSFE